MLRKERNHGWPAIGKLEGRMVMDMFRRESPNSVGISSAGSRLALVRVELASSRLQISHPRTFLPAARLPGHSLIHSLDRLDLELRESTWERQIEMYNNYGGKVSACCDST